MTRLSMKRKEKGLNLKYMLVSICLINYISELPIKTVTVVAKQIFLVRIWQIILKINIVGLPTNHVLFVKIPTNSTNSKQNQFRTEMKNHYEKINSRGKKQHCDRCSKPNIFGADVKKHINSTLCDTYNV